MLRADVRTGEGGEAGIIKKIAFVLLIVGICIGCAACQRMTDVNESVAEPALFSTVEDYGIGSVIVDNETGVMYWISRGTYNGGTLTLLVDETGDPKIFERQRSGND